jgi:hypothetical protein
MSLSGVDSISVVDVLTPATANNGSGDTCDLSGTLATRPPAIRHLGTKGALDLPCIAFPLSLETQDADVSHLIASALAKMPLTDQVGGASDRLSPGESYF